MAPKPFHEDESAAVTVHQQKVVTESPEAIFDLAVVSGPDAGLAFVLDANQSARVHVGKGPTCELRLRDPAASRRHAAIELVGPRARITDLGSTNGTWVNSVAVLEGWLHGGERIQIGSDVISVQRRAETSQVPLPIEGQFGKVIGASREMRRLYPLCVRLAASTIPVIIEGETGTGKEALAEALHAEGPRAAGPFVVFDCTAVPATMVEAELFGHERGAFTGAVNRHVGVLEQASGGTLLIDEIGDLDLTLQPKLLRAIERGEFRRIGGQQSVRVDVRILAATRRNLDREVEQGRFRDDLFHRLAVGRIELPPLRHRTGDIEVLARAFCRDLGGDEAALPPHLIAQWREHSWPGNVRELRNALARYLALGDQMTAALGAATPAQAQPGSSTRPPPSDGQADVARVADEVIAEGLPLVRARQRVVDVFEERYLEAMLARHGGVVTRAAEAAGIARRHFQRLRARPR